MTGIQPRFNDERLAGVKRRVLWFAAVLFVALAYLAGITLVEKINEHNDARKIRNWTETAIIFSQVIHELQKERGLSSGLIAAKGTQFEPAWNEQHRSTDRLVERMRERSRGGNDPTTTLAQVLADLETLGELRRGVKTLEMGSEDAVTAYARLISPLLELLMTTTSVGGGHAILRQQIAFLSFLQVKEMMGQERAHVTALLASRNHGLSHLSVFHRIKAKELAYEDIFSQFASDHVLAAYQSMLAEPDVTQVDQMRQVVLREISGETPLGQLIPRAPQWFDAASRKIDALKGFEHILSDELLRSAQILQDEAQLALAFNALATLLSLALAGVLGRQLWRGKQMAESDLALGAQVFDNSVEAIVIADDRLRIVDVNQAFTRISGFSRDEVIGKAFQTLIAQCDDDTFLAAMWSRLGHAGVWEGEVLNRRKSGELYPALLSVVSVRDDHRVLSHNIGMCIDLTKYKETEALLEKVRTFDLLTGLPNRESWRSLVDEAVVSAHRRGQRLAIINIGIDRFMLINESLGHDVGDEVLRGTGERIRQLLRPGDVTARLVGDRFAVLLPTIADARSIGTWCERLLASFGEPILAHGQPLQVSVSIGVALYPDDGKDSQTLLRNGEAALNSAKEGGRGHYKFYSSEMNTGSARILVLEQLLWHALERQEFSVVYQPQIDARTGRMLGTEALLRWHSPQLGIVSPAQFIPIAETTGMIIAIGEWILREACAQAQLWRGRYDQNLQVAVNLSPCQFLSRDLLPMVLRVLEETGLPAEGLELEITEGALAEDPVAAAHIMDCLRKSNVKVALDDFGTGYSSLAQLKRFPLDRLKLDRAFIEDLPHNASDRAISRTVIALGHNLGLDVLAEGIETQAQLDFLVGAGCEFFQGYYFARPMAADELEAWIEAREPERAMAPAHNMPSCE